MKHFWYKNTRLDDIKAVSLDLNKTSTIDLLAGDQFSKTCSSNQSFVLTNIQIKDFRLFITGGDINISNLFSSLNKEISIEYGENTLSLYDPIYVNRVHVSIESITYDKILLSIDLVTYNGSGGGSDDIVDTEARIRINNLENNETIYEVYENIATSQTGSITTHTEATIIFDRYANGIDALCVKLDEQGRPLDEIAETNQGEPIMVDSFGIDGSYTLSAIPNSDSGIVYQELIKDKFKANIPIDSIVGTSDTFIPIHNTFIVAKSGGDYETIEDALNAVSNNSSTNRFLIIVHSGIFTENNPLPLKDYVTIKSAGNDLNTRVVAGNPAANLFEVIDNDVVFSYLQDLSLSGVDSTHYAVYNNKASQIACRALTLLNCGKGFHLNNVGGIFDISTLHIIASTTMASTFEILAGQLYLTDFLVIGQSIITEVFTFDGSDTKANLVDIKSDSANVTTLGRITNGAYLIGKALHTDNAYDGFIISGDNTNVDFNALSMHEISNDAITVENVGTGIRVSFFGGSILGVGRWAFNILNPNCTIIGNGHMELPKVNAIEGAEFYASIIDLTKGDEGTNIFGELHVGTPLNPTESVFGEGDSYSRGMIVFSYDGSAFTNISSNAGSPDDGTDVTFPNVNVDTALYFASAISKGGDYLKHQGLKIATVTAAVLGSGNFVLELWDGAAWVDVHFMVTQSSSPYRPKAENIFIDPESEQARYDIAVGNGEYNWVKNDPTGLGVDLYYVRIRIAAAITTAPIIRQFKLHSNRTEINSDGYLEYFGNARSLGTLNWKITDAIAWQSSPGNQDLFVLDSADGNDYDLGVGRMENEFVDGATDKISFGLPLPVELDTGCAIIVEVYYSLNNAVAGNIYWKTSKGITGVGEAMGETTGDISGGVIRDYEITNSLLPVPLDSDNKMLYMSFNVYVSKAIARKVADNSSDVLTLSILRDASDALDTYNGNAAIYQVRAKFYKWTNGGHV